MQSEFLGKHVTHLLIVAMTAILGTLAIQKATPQSFPLPGPIAESLRKADVFSEDGRRERLLLDMIQITTDTLPAPEQRGPLAKRLASEFDRYTRFFLKPEYVPSKDRIQASLTFLDSSASASGADVASLDWEIDGRRIRVAQTGKGVSGSIGICIELQDEDLEPEGIIESYSMAVRKLFDKLLIEDPRAAFAVGSLEPAPMNCYWIRPDDPGANYRRNLQGVIYSKCACVVFHVKHPYYRLDETNVSVDPPVPARGVSPEYWFDDFLNHP